MVRSKKTFNSKKLDQKRYESFEITKDIRQGAFQLKLMEEWMIHNMFNKDLLIQYKEPQIKGKHMEPTLLLDIINKKEYEVEEV